MFNLFEPIAEGRYFIFDTTEENGPFVVNNNQFLENQQTTENALAFESVEAAALYIEIFQWSAWAAVFDNVQKRLVELTGTAPE